MSSAPKPFLPMPAFWLASLITFSLFSAPASAQLYKWVDADGNVRYSDRMPPDQRGMRHQKLSTQGQVLETTEAALSPEELKQKRAEEQKKAEQARKEAEEIARIKAEKEHHDRVLLMTFSNENEIVEVEKERVAVITSVISLLNKNREAEQAKLQEHQKTAKINFIDQGKAVPGGLQQKIEYSGEKIRGIDERLALKKIERERLKQQYAEDMLRYRELTQGASNGSPSN